MNGLSIVVDLRELATPLSECLTARKGDVESGLVASLRANDFEQAPVLGQDGEPIGVIATDTLDDLRSEGRQLDLMSEAIDRTRLAYLSPMDLLLAALGASRGVIVGTNKSEPQGLVTVSDLNRHEFRRYLYGPLAEMEALLAQLIDVTFDDAWKWIHTLPRSAQTRIVRVWERAQHDHIDIGAQAYANLGDMLQALAGCPDILNGLDVNGASQLGDHLGDVPKLRNRVMHAVQPLVRSSLDAQWVSTVLDDVHSLTARIAETLKKGGHGRRLRWH